MDNTLARWGYALTLLTACACSCEGCRQKVGEPTPATKPASSDSDVSPSLLPRMKAGTTIRIWPMAPLHQAAEEGNVEQVTSYLRSGCDVNALENCTQATALHCAVAGGHAEVVEALLSYGALLEIRDMNGFPALHWAALVGDNSMTSRLLDAGADTHVVDQDGRTALYWASALGWQRVSETLLAKGAEPNARASHGEAPLHGAALGGHRAAVGILLAGGADPRIKDNSGKTALDYAVARGHESIISLLRTRGAVAGDQGHMTSSPPVVPRAASTDPADKRPDIYEAARQGNVKEVEVCLDSGADINASNEFGMSALHEACLAGSTDVVRVLLSRGADVTSNPPHRGGGPLHAAAFNGHEEIVRLLVLAGADINVANHMGATALHKAACGGHNGVVLLLVGAGARLDAKDENGTTPIHWAEWGDKKRVVLPLLVRRAESLGDSEGSSALVPRPAFDKENPDATERVGTVIALAKSGEIDVTMMVALVRGMGPAVIPSLTRVLKDGDPFESVLVIVMLKDIGPGAKSLSQKQVGCRYKILGIEAQKGGCKDAHRARSWQVAVFG